MRFAGRRNDRETAITEAICGMECFDRFLNQDEGYTADDAAKALAKGYAGLCFLEEKYKKSFNEERHYTKDDAYYLMTMGAHEETERVQTSGPSDGVARAVANVDSFLARLNREADEEFYESVVEPYMRVIEQKRLFDFSLNFLEPWLSRVAVERYQNKTAVNKTKDADGNPMTYSRMEKAEKEILKNLAYVLGDYRESCKADGMGIRKKYAAEVIASRMPDHIARRVQDYMKEQEASQAAPDKQAVSTKQAAPDQLAASRPAAE